MKNSMYLSLPVFLFFTAGSLGFNDLSTALNSKPGQSFAESVDSTTELDYAGVRDVDVAHHDNYREGKIQKSNDPILNAIIFEYCSKQCGDPRIIENAQCWFHCRYTFYLLNRRIRK